MDQGPPEAPTRPARSLVDRFLWAPLHDLAHPPAGQVPALDALRACAVLYVILVHARGGYLELGGLDSRVTRSLFVRAGWTGVDLFFVLSGYLIGKQLWRELVARGTVDVGRFVLRRGFRIWPLYFAFFFFTVLVLGHAQLPFVAWWQDLTFTTNYFGHELVPGSWSLSTEEQFYVLTPLLLVAAARFVPDLRSHRRYLCCALLVLPALRALTWWHLTGSLTHHDGTLFLDRIYTPIHLHSDALFVGLILANLAVTGDAERSALWSSPWLAAGAVLIGGALAAVQREVFSFSAVALLFGACVRYAVSPKRRPSFPSSRAFYVISRLSFGMYLNHRYFEDFTISFCLRHVPFAVEAQGAHFLVTYAVLVALSTLVAVVTFCLIEHPFLALRSTLVDRKRAEA